MARLVRAYAAAAATFQPGPDEQPDPGLPDPPGIPPAPPYPPELIGHVDITPENVVFQGGKAVALIDFDLAKWATRADEIFNMMRWWAPHQPPSGVAGAERAPAAASAHQSVNRISRTKPLAAIRIVSPGRREPSGL